MRCSTVVVYVLAAMALMTVQPFAVQFTQNGAGGYDYLVLSTTLMTEAVKLGVSLCVYSQLHVHERTHHLLHRRDVLHFAVPALVYALNNALVFAIVSSIRPTAFQLLSSTKTVFTALMFRLVLRRVLTTTHHAAVVLLAAGAAVSRLGCNCICWGPEYPEYGSGSGEPAAPSSEWVGVILTLLSCVASSLGGVLNEALLKREGQVHSLFLQNALLYAWGVLINAAALGIRDYEGLRQRGFFGGYSPPVALMLITNAATGLSISFVLKHGDNLLRVFAHVCAMLLSMLIDSIVLQAPPEPHLVLAVIVVGGSAVVYAREGPPRPLRQAPELLRATIAMPPEPTDPSPPPPPPTEKL